MRNTTALISLSLIVLLSGCSSVKDEDTYQYQYGYEKGGEDGYREGYNDALSEEALDYVQKNYFINEVFSDSQITEYVRDNYAMTDIYDIDDIVDFAADYLIEHGWTVIDSTEEKE